MTCNHGDGAKYPTDPVWRGSCLSGCSYCDCVVRYGKERASEMFCSDPSCHRALDDEGPLCSVCKAEGLADSL